MMKLISVLKVGKTEEKPLVDVHLLIDVNVFEGYKTLKEEDRNHILGHKLFELLNDRIGE